MKADREKKANKRTPEVLVSVRAVMITNGASATKPAPSSRRAARTDAEAKQAGERQGSNAALVGHLFVSG
jgi:hypothetical protein